MKRDSEPFPLSAIKPVYQPYEQQV